MTADGLGEWHRLHPLSPVVRGGRAVVLLLVLAVPRLLTTHRDLTGLLIDGIGAAAVVVAGRDRLAGDPVANRGP